MDRDANIALFQEAAATVTAREPAGQPKGSSGAAAAAGASSAGDGSATASGGGVDRFLLVATFEGREAKAAVPMQRCVHCLGSGNMSVLAWARSAVPSCLALARWLAGAPWA